MSERHQEILHDDPIEFYEWKKQQDFYYELLDSKVIDYVNSVVNYDVVDEVVAEEAVDEIEWSEMFHQFGISEDSDEAEIAREQIEAYIDAQQ